jgi:hypothetical protein
MAYKPQVHMCVLWEGINICLECNFIILKCNISIWLTHVTDFYYRVMHPVARNINL